ncbi:sulfurtransferase [Evansella clarkii]|uniref:sulfurtransferase n=1 Tax=Evansella clarkii TaxID=79879 RepID=UPI001476751A|nr:sulfurtransferase [Evansella clarkii]
MGLIISTMYRRYWPVRGVKFMSYSNAVLQDNEAVLDIRDFNAVSDTGLSRVINIPVPYLKRHYKDIDKRYIYILGSDKAGCNLTARFLKKKGFKIKGSLIINQDNKRNVSHKWREAL